MMMELDKKNLKEEASSLQAITLTYFDQGFEGGNCTVYMNISQYSVFDVSAR